MSARVKKYRHHLRQLRDASPKIRKILVNNCHPEMLSCICECAVNVLRGHVPLNNAQKNKLRRHKRSLRLLTDKKVAAERKKTTSTNRRLPRCLIDTDPVVARWIAR